MKNKYLLLVLLANMFAFTSFGQIPGYLGKRFIIHTNIHSMLATNGPTAANRGWSGLYFRDTNSIALSNRFELQCEYATSRQGAVVLGVDYFKTGMVLNASTQKFNTGNGSYSLDRHYLFYNLTSFGVNLGFSRYLTSRGALAPMGKHRTFSFWAKFVNGKILDKKTEYADSNIKTHQKILIDPKFVHYGISFTSHENTIFLDKLVLNIGWQINLPFDLVALRDNNNYSSEGTAEENQIFYDNAARLRLRNHDLITMKIGFGYLAF
jgi:hypothetical protein